MLQKLKVRAKQFKIDIPAVFIALRKRETPLIAKMLAAIVVVYALSPVDLIPDFIPVLGYLDDLLILPGLVALTVRLVPRELFAQCRAEAEGIWKDGRPKAWIYALPFVVIWVLIAAVIARAIWF